MARIVVTETLSERGIEAMRAGGHDVEVRTGLSTEELGAAVRGAAALVVRSATKVTAALLQEGRDLVVVGRAGVGLDNVDVAAATDRGVMVVNAPESNVLSAAEHAMALLLAQARNIPQAHAALVAGRWEHSTWEGVELSGKTLGIVGLGRIGTLVAKRAQAFDMRIVAHDPYVSEDRARRIGVELMSLQALVEVSDFLTVHLPMTPETSGLIGKELLGKAKAGIRIVNAARGGVLDEEALAGAISTGQVAGAALDVFASEPCTDSPLFGLPGVVVTPHLGASTGEAQDKAGEQIAEQILLALAGEFVPNAVNVAARSASETVRPFLGLAESLGHVMAAMSDGLPDSLEIAVEGALASEDTGMVSLAALKGVLQSGSDEPVSYVNAPRVAEQRGLSVVESSTATPLDYVSLITLRSRRHAVSGTLAGRTATERIVMIDDHGLELPFAENLLLVRNDDRAGMIGIVGTALGEAGVSISSMAVGQTVGAGTALMALATDVPVPDDVLDRLRSRDGILDVHRVHGTGSPTGS